MRKRWQWFSLLAGVVISLLALWPVQTVEVASVEGEQRWCAIVQPNATVVYLSMNSIYRVPVTEWWAIQGEIIRVTRVDSTPIVLDYYGITDYEVDARGQATGAPGLAYTSLRMTLTEQGQQRLRVGGREIVLGEVVPEGVLTIRTRYAPRLIACR